ncbi:hypothetical protein Sjap_019102 [Stephania japonica]|uniref:Fe2OG dioxygenase domain-containing protein n=1 Tax=Stephania japonica TaxID=461633 RepID=A0AAP0HUE9_9MAGN
MGLKCDDETNHHKIPILDFTSIEDLKEGSDGWNQLCDQVREASEKVGCFQVVYNDQVPDVLRQEMAIAIKELFDLPEETKQKNTSPKPYYGYLSKSEVVPLYESFGIDDAPSLAGAQAFTDLMWPAGHPTFCYGAMKYYDENVEGTEHILRVMKYEAPSSNDGEAIGLTPHTDKGVLTILYQDEVVQGLQVLSDEGHWIGVSPMKGIFTIFIGEALKAWSNGRLVAARHRVIMSGKKKRYSYALFATPKEGTIVEVPLEMVDKEHPLMFRPFNFMDFLYYFYANHTSDNTLETYAGVLKNVSAEMGSVPHLGLPVVAFCKEDLKPGTPEWNSVKNQVMQALQEHGAFEAVYNKVSSELSDDLYCGLKDLFDLPIETKRRITCKRIYNSYLKFPICESMGIEDAHLLENAQSFTNTLWPEGNPNMCETLNSFAKKITELDEMVRRMVLEGFGVEKYCDEHFESTFTSLRINKYEAPNTNEGILAFNPHTDESVVTILHQTQVRGLQVQSKDGEWFNVKLSPNSFLVMAGDIFLAFVNGRLHSPYHRVIMRGTEDRYSAVLFSVPKVGCEVRTREELIDKEHPQQYKPFDYDKYLDFICANDAPVVKSPLRVFCGL